MSTILRRLKTAFPNLPITCSGIPTHELHPNKATAWHDMLAGTLAMLAAAPDGGLLVLGLTPQPPHCVLGVCHPNAWTTALRTLASSLAPPMPIEIEAGQEEEHTLLVARVSRVSTDPIAPSAPARNDPAYTLAPLPERPSPARSPLLEPVADSSPLWFDPDVASLLRLPEPGTWSRSTRATLAERGLLASNGVQLTHAGLLLAALPEHRTEDMVILVNHQERVAVLEHGWLLVRAPLRRVLSAANIPHIELVTDLVLDVLARTTPPRPSWPFTLFLSPEYVIIETNAQPTGDNTLPRMLAQLSRWRPGSQQALAESGVRVTSGPGERGLCVQIGLIPAEKPRPTPPASPRPARTAPPPKRAPAPEPTALPQPREHREAAVLALLADGRSRSRRALDAELGWSRSTLRNVLEALVKSGRVVTEASSPRSPHQAYRAA
jgi:hypothetical protein